MLKRIFKVVLTTFLATLVFLGVAYLYLNYNFKRDIAADQKEYNVPYEQRPQNAEILFELPYNGRLSVLLDFENMQIIVSDQETQAYEYYYITLTKPMIEGIVDRVGGVNLKIDGETFRYTGVQVADLLSGGYGSDLKNQIINQVFAQISKNGFFKSDFIYLIENAETDLSLVDCLGWIGYIKQMNITVQMSTD